uniref:ATP-dependent DNA helicase n=1 Tax=Globodera pallida TaxID=36090 RepID=A0A183BTU6_GLOPA
MGRFNDLQNRPGELMALLHNQDTATNRMRDSFFKNCLAYNSHLSFGQISLQRSTDKRAFDKRIIKCNNMMQYAIWDFNPPSASLPALHGQLFTLPPVDAHARVSEISAEHKLDPAVMQFLFELLRRHHPYAALYETAAETFRKLPNEQQVNLRMLLVDSTPHGEERVYSEDLARPAPVIPPADQQNVQQIHPGRLGVQTVEGSRLVAQFYLDDGSNVIPSNPYDVVLTGRKGTGIRHMKWSNRNIDPALFPLLFCRGQCGYERGIPLRLREGEHLDSHFVLRNLEQNVLAETDELGEEAEFLGATNERIYNRRDKVSFAQWFRYMAQIRGPNWRNPHWLWDLGTIAQLYTLTFNNRAEAQKVQYMKRKQGKRRLQGPIGRVYMTDEHFRGSRQFYQREYANCMTLCREFGAPDLLVTFTMSPDCPELEEMLATDASGKKQQWFDRPDLVCRLFVDKLKELYKDLTERCVLGPVRACGLPHVHTAIILDWERMRSIGNIQEPTDYIEEYISAEIPSNPPGRTKEAVLQRFLHKIITTKNIHTCSTNHCLQDGKCKKNFPKPFEYDNVYSEHAYPRYKRRPPATSPQEQQKNPDMYGNVLQYKARSGKIVLKDNSHVVPFNSFLSGKYAAHINVEFVAGEGCVKYLCKYMMKGADMAFVEVKDANTGQNALNYDELHQIRLARYISSMEAFLQQLGTPIIKRSHEVDELDVHGPQGHRIAVEQGFEEEEEQQNAFCEAAQAEEERRERGQERVTQLTAYFAFNANREPDDALRLTYGTCYKKLRYDVAKKEWKLYVLESRAGHKLCRLKTVSPSDLELLAIRQLLLHVHDPRGWEHLRTVDNQKFPTFAAAARARNLMSDMTIWLKTIREAFNTKKRINQRLRWLAVFFATANLTSPGLLLDEIMQDANKWLVSTKVSKAPHDQQLQYVLRALEWFLLANGIRPDTECREDGTFETACERIGLPRPEGIYMTADQFVQLTFFRDNVINDNVDGELLGDQNTRLQRVEDYYRNKYFEDPKPNEEQQQLIDLVYNAVVDAQQVISGQQTQFTPGLCRLFMVTGEGGAGKTFSYNKIIARAKASRLNFLPMATTGIAAELLYEGQTVHKRLCRARHVDASTPLNVDYESNFAHMLRSIHGMIIDEISMQNRDVLEYVDRLLRSVAPKRLQNIAFAGKVVVLGGDWKQLTPVIPRGGHLDQKAASVKSSPLFKLFTTIRLSTNHRLQAGQEQYRNFLKRVGAGLINDSKLHIKLPACMVEPDRDALINFVFPPHLLQDPLGQWEQLAGRAILCPLNRETLELNNIIMDRMVSREKIFSAFTTLIQDESAADVDLQNNMADLNYENLSRLTPPGIPEHFLRVKIGAVMMLTSNISLEEGLCNGTRVQILEMFNHIIRCRILTGTQRGNMHDLHVARFLFGGDPKAPHEGLFRCERIQFPLRPGSVMTVNKAQGQTLSHVGVLLDRSRCFSHGQLYVALSRVRQAQNIKVCTKRADRLVQNIVITELLDPVDRNAPTQDTSSGDDPLHLTEGVTKELLRKCNIVKGDITKQQVYMVVNAANTRLEKGGGVDDAIHRACRDELSMLHCYLDDYLEQFNGTLPEGSVVVTPAYGDLRDNIEWIAHAVGPVLWGSTPTTENFVALRKCYTAALEHLLTAEMPADRAFPCISTGASSFPRDAAAKTAFESVLNWLADDIERAANVEEIRFVTFNSDDYMLYKELFEKTKRQIVGSRSTTPRSSQHTQRTSLSIPVQDQNSVCCVNNVGLGDCFYRAITISLFGSDNEASSDLLRVAVSRQLSAILQNANYFPRLQYASYNEFLEHLRLALLDVEAPQWFDQNLETYASYIARPFRKTGGWAQVDDAYMVAILLRRPVAIVHPNATREQLQAHAAQWNDSNQYPQVIDVYFPDGIARRVQNNMPLEDLQQFNLLCDNGEGLQFQRQVTNPIVLWYNGLNHFETIVLVYKLIQLAGK